MVIWQLIQLELIIPYTTYHVVKPKYLTEPEIFKALGEVYRVVKTE